MSNDPNSRVVYIGCDCHHPLHFIKLESITDYDTDTFDELYFHIVSTAPNGFWGRLVAAYKHLFYGEEIVLNELCLTKDQLLYISDEFDKFAKVMRDVE